MREEEILNLNEKEIQKIERVNQAIADKEQAEAEKERQKKRRVLYERAPKKSLSFIIYCIYVGAWGGVTLYSRLPNFSGNKFYFLGVIIVIVMILPLFSLPSNNWMEAISSIKKKIKN